MRISDWSSDVCSSDLLEQLGSVAQAVELVRPELHHRNPLVPIFAARIGPAHAVAPDMGELALDRVGMEPPALIEQGRRHRPETMGGHLLLRSEEHTSELQSLMRISYAVFCLKKKIQSYS